MSGFSDPRLRTAQKLAFDADRALRDGDAATAASLYGQAAPLEAAVARDVPADRPRVRGVIAVSAAALWYKAGRYAEARRLAAEFLADPEVAEVAELELRELVARCELRTLPPVRVIHLSDLHFGSAAAATEWGVLIRRLQSDTVSLPPSTRISPAIGSAALRRPPRRREVA